MIRTFDVVCSEGYEEECLYIIGKFKKHGYYRNALKPDLVVVLKGDGGISEEGKNQAKKGNPDAIILGVRKPRKGELYSRGTLAQVKDWREIDRYIKKIDRGEYSLVEHMGVNLFIDEKKEGTAFNEVLAIRDTGIANQTIKFYLYWLHGPYHSKKSKLFTRNFTEGFIVADGVAIGPPLGRGGYQKTGGVPDSPEGIGVGVISPSVEKKDMSTRLIEFLFRRQFLLKGFVAPEDSVIEFQLRRGDGFIYVDHDRVADISPKSLNTFQVKKSEQRVRFIEFRPS